MAREFIYICDGCDNRVSSKSSERPTYWADVNIDVTGYTNWTAGGTPATHVDRLICSSCQITLRDRADPKKWIRTERETDE